MPNVGFTGYKDLIEEGDYVIVYLYHGLSSTIRVTRGDVFQCKFGALRHDYIIGKRYGSKVECTRGHAYILQCTPERWCRVLEHRTQIIYPQDAGLIALSLDLRPGSRVAEAGTGSGALSHSLARTVAPSGKLYTFEFHEQRSQKMQKDVASHGLSDVIAAAHRDVCGDGFPAELADSLDAVFLDLPTPWSVIEHAKAVLNSHIPTRICLFSPCMEQVQRSITALVEQGFTDLETVECVPRTMKQEKISLASIAQLQEGSVEHKPVEYETLIPYPAKQPTHTGYLTSATLLPRKH